MEIIVRASVLYAFLLLLTRSLGKRELAELSAFELLLLVTVGDLIQQGVTQEDTSVTGAMLAVSTIALWALLASWAGFRWRVVRRITEGVPVIVMRDGKPLKEAMRGERIVLDEVRESARQQGISDLSAINVAILEPDGRFSFLLHDGKHRPAPEPHRD